jgi:8-hydroxy-5-deazaflavin:NADPH oxidoreductase
MGRTIAVLGGTGSEGFGLALRWARAGENVIISSRDLQRAQAAAEKIRQTVGPNAKISGQHHVDACRTADLLVLTVPFEGHATLLKELAPAMRPGTILVDASVPLAASLGGRASRTIGVWQGSAAQQAAEIVPARVAVVAAFQNVGSEILKADGPVDCDVIVCSDDPEAGKLVRNVAVKIPGVRALDGGKLENARILEQITALLIGLSRRHKGHAGIRITGLPAAAYNSQ